MLKLTGIYPPIATPFTADGEIYPAKLKYNVDKLNGVNLTGYVVCGSTGESVMLTPDEKRGLFAAVAQHSKPGKQLLCGTGVESVRETVALTNQAAEMGYVAAMVRTPHYYKNLLDNVDAQVTYFRAVADQSRIPIMIYNWPQATGVDIAAEAVQQHQHGHGHARSVALRHVERAVALVVRDAEQIGRAHV